MENKNIFNNIYVITILALISCFLWGSAFPSVKIGYEVFSIGADDTYKRLVFAGYRFFLSSMLIFIFCILTKRSLKVKKHDILKVTFLGIMQTSIQYLFFYIGLSNTSGTKGSILASTTTFFSVILSSFFYEEDKLTFRKIIGVILGFMGVTIVNMSGGGNIQSGFSFTGEGFILISSLVGALAAIYTKKIAKDIPPFIVSGYQLFIGSIFLILSGYLGGSEGLEFTPQGLILLLYLGFISAAAFSIWTVLLKYNGVGRISIYKFCIPLFGILLSYIFLGERILGLNVFMAAILVMAGIIIINKSEEVKS